MKIIPVQLLSPQPSKGLAWAMVVKDLKEISLDTINNDVSHCSLMDFLSGQLCDAFQGVNILDGQFLVIGFQEHNLGPAYHVLVQASPKNVLPAIIGDERRPVPFLDDEQYQPRLATWRPGVQNLQKAAQSPVFAFALRVAFELSETAKKASDAPPKPTDDDLVI